MRAWLCAYAAALSLTGASAAAQSMQDMPGMQTPSQTRPAQPPQHRRRHHSAPQTAPAPSTPPAPPHEQEQPSQQAPNEMQSAPHSAPHMDDDQMQAMAHAQTPMGEAMRMSGALGPYAMSREASGTSWQPDAGAHEGVHIHNGAWMLMTHALINGVYDWQDGPRGGDKAFLAGMIMGMARRDFANGDALQLRAMLSPDPFMGASGYPLLFQTGETADGLTPLVDRQHPHDLFMELSASFSHRLSDADSVFVYAGLPGEPAFGPPAFMHRMSAMDSPEAPITHHWLDSDHVTFGVVTGGWVHGDWKLEASRFRGREPDQHRYDIETGDLDSSAVRVSWNPTQNWSLQASWADVASPEQLHPEQNETRWSASAIYTHALGEHGWWSATGAFGAKQRSDGVTLDAWLAEAALHPNQSWTVFTRAESIETDELAPGVHRVGRLSLGAIRDWRIHAHAVFGVGALVEAHFTPSALDASYDGEPLGAMGFVRLKIS